MARVDLSFGDATGEYLALREDAGVVAGQHEALRVHGSDAISFLQGLLTQEIEDAPVGSVLRSMLLTPRGKLRSLLWLLRGDDEVIVVVDDGLGESVSQDLRRFKIRIDATIEEPEPVFEVWGPQGHRVLKEAGVATPEGWARSGATIVARVPLAGLPRFMLVGDTVALDGVRKVGEGPATAVRVEAGEPLTGRDLDDRTLVHETGLDAQAVSYDKGCYLGQEVVARIEYRGHVNRLLRGVTLTENVIPPEGASLIAGDKQVGVLTSVSESLDSPIGLSLVRVEVESGTIVEVQWEGGHAGAVVHDLPLDSFTQF